MKYLLIFLLTLLATANLSARENQRWFRIGPEPRTSLHRLSESNHQGTVFRSTWKPEPSKNLERIINKNIPEARPPATFAAEIFSISEAALILESLYLESLKSLERQHTPAQKPVTLGTATQTESLF